MQWRARVIGSEQGLLFVLRRLSRGEETVEPLEERLCIVVLLSDLLIPVTLFH